MFDKFTQFAEAHPKAVVAVALFLVFASVDNYARVSNWANGLEQIEASEFYGG